jgi:high-affinity iron transporter
MLQAFVITLREGLEAFLIVAISVAYLRRSGRAVLASAVHWGVAGALAVSALGGYLLYSAANQEWLDLDGRTHVARRSPDEGRH